MPMTKYIYLVHKGQDGYHHSVVTRVADGATKYFYQCGGSVEGLTFFFEHMTDELAESYFPRVDKKGKVVGGVDCWLYLGENPDRIEAERLAADQFTKYRLENPV